MLLKCGSAIVIKRYRKKKRQIFPRTLVSVQTSLINKYLWNLYDLPGQRRMTQFCSQRTHVPVAARSIFPGHRRCGCSGVRRLLHAGSVLSALHSVLLGPLGYSLRGQHCFSHFSYGKKLRLTGVRWLV